jgi:glyoxylase-like metal-dependent hydrolase (beta-lactamase superfamily II)
MRRLTTPLAALVALALAAGPAARADRDRDDDDRNERPSVELTWMSIANWYFKMGDLRIIMDGYFTRVPQKLFFGGGGGLQFTTAPFSVDVPAVVKVRYALDAGGEVDYVIAGHSHFDHTYDTATWSALTNAPIVGGLSTCLQAQAEGLPASQCINVKGGERMRLSHAVTMRVVRWNHSGNPATNPEQHNPVELKGVPVPDPVTGGLRAGVGEDFPNGGGGRMYLFTIGHGPSQLSFFVNNSASAVDLDVPIVVDGVNYGAPIDNLRKAMADAGLTSVDLWIGTGGTAIAQLVVPVLHPRAYIPNHWDGLYSPFFKGLPARYQDATLKAYLDAQGIPMFPQTQYFDKYRLDQSGVTKIPNTAQKAKLGFPDVQPFTAAATLRSAAAQTTSDDCN